MSSANFIVNEGGGGLEVLGATEAVNSMLMQSHEKFIRLFPTWPLSEPASFKSLRAQGAFLVSASHMPGIETDTGTGTGTVRAMNVTVASEAGGVCSMLDVWSSSNPQVQVQVDQIDPATGKVVRSVPVRRSTESGPGTVPAGAIFRFDTTQGQLYAVSASASRSSLDGMRK